MILHKRFVLFVLLFLSFSVAEAQILEPVKWSFASKKTSDTEAELIFTATIDNGWHLYSQDIPPNGPVPTEFVIDKGTAFSRVGKVVEPKPIMEKDPNFDDMLLKFFSTKAVFKQKNKTFKPHSFCR